MNFPITLEVSGNYALFSRPEMKVERVSYEVPTPSAARPAGSLNPRALIVFKHDSQLGNFHSHKLFDAVSVKKRDGIEVPSSFDDYEVTIDRDAIPSGIEIIERI